MRKKAAGKLGFAAQAASTWPMPARREVAAARQPAGDRQHLGRGRSAASAPSSSTTALMAEDAPRFDGRALCGAGARRFAAMPTSARSAGGSTSGWPRSAASASRRGSSATSTTRRRPRTGSARTLEELARLAEPGRRPRRPARGGSSTSTSRARGRPRLRRRPTRSRPRSPSASTSTAAARPSRRSISSCRSPGSGLDLRARQFARHRAAERPGDGRGGAARGGPRGRRAAARAADERARHHRAVAARDGGLRQVQPGARASRAARRRRLARQLEGRQIVDLLEAFPVRRSRRSS